MSSIASLSSLIQTHPFQFEIQQTVQAKVKNKKIFINRIPFNVWQNEANQSFVRSWRLIHFKTGKPLGYFYNTLEKLVYIPNFKKLQQTRAQIHSDGFAVLENRRPSRFYLIGKKIYPISQDQFINLFVKGPNLWLKIFAILFSALLLGPAAYGYYALSQRVVEKIPLPNQTISKVAFVVTPLLMKQKGIPLLALSLLSSAQPVYGDYWRVNEGSSIQVTTQNNTQEPTMAVALDGTKILTAWAAPSYASYTTIYYRMFDSNLQSLTAPAPAGGGYTSPSQFTPLATALNNYFVVGCSGSDAYVSPNSLNPREFYLNYYNSNGTNFKTSKLYLNSNNYVGSFSLASTPSQLGFMYLDANPPRQQVFAYAPIISGGIQNQLTFQNPNLPNTFSLTALDDFSIARVENANYAQTLVSLENYRLNQTNYVYSNISTIPRDPNNNAISNCRFPDGDVLAVSDGKTFIQTWIIRNNSTSLLNTPTHVVHSVSVTCSAGGWYALGWVEDSTTSGSQNIQNCFYSVIDAATNTPIVDSVLFSASYLPRQPSLKLATLDANPFSIIYQNNTNISLKPITVQKIIQPTPPPTPTQSPATPSSSSSPTPLISRASTNWQVDNTKVVATVIIGLCLKFFY